MLKFAGLPKPVQDIAKLDPANGNDAQKKTAVIYFIENVYAKTRDSPRCTSTGGGHKGCHQLDKQIPTTLVVMRPSRGRPRSKSAVRYHAVQAAPQTPAFLPPMTACTAPCNRLGFAHWPVLRVAVDVRWR